MAGRTWQDWLIILSNDSSSDSSTSAGTDVVMPSMVLDNSPTTFSCLNDYCASEEVMELRLQMRRDRLRRGKSLEGRKKPLWGKLRVQSKSRTQGLRANKL